ncbi:DUF4044 domain-containing protein [Apilactobacillus apisilvae]|uniref:DUF4044 domain-containing protein n=1 Tax=Apilactobacillus apisilvae TaxID=2923364 RepID=A0ABY4PJR3_9LACO|nr:DUF4044 domain-containing protein [Apilactobacillus apisilvae]
MIFVWVMIISTVAGLVLGSVYSIMQ